MSKWGPLPPPDDEFAAHGAPRRPPLAALLSPLSVPDTKQIAYSFSPTHRSTVWKDLELDFSFGVKESPVSPNNFFQRGAVAGVYRSDSVEILTSSSSILPAIVETLSTNRGVSFWSRARRVGKDDDPGRDGSTRSSARSRSTSSRSKIRSSSALPQEGRRHQRELHATPIRFRRVCARSCARIPTSF